MPKDAQRVFCAPWIALHGCRQNCASSSPRNFNNSLLFHLWSCLGSLVHCMTLDLTPLGSSISLCSASIFTPLGSMRAVSYFSLLSIAQKTIVQMGQITQK